MITPIQIIKSNEQSANVANLHAAMQALGMTVDPAEVKDQRAGESTAKLITEFQRQKGLVPQPGELVDSATAAAANQMLQARGLLSTNGQTTYTVYGTVTGPDGQPARELAVKAFDQDMRKRQTLGQGVTDANGKYKITYSTSQFSQAELGGPDLVIEVYSQSSEVLATSEVNFNAPSLARIDLTVDDLGSEAKYDRIVRMLTPLLDGQGVTLSTLEENDKIHDLSFAAGETGIYQSDLTDFAVAQRMPETTKLPAEFWFAVLNSKAMTSQSFGKPPTGVATMAADVMANVPSTPVAKIQTGLTNALAGNLIAQKFKESVPVWLREYAALQSNEAMKEGSTSPVRTIIAASGVPSAKSDALLQAYLQGGSRNDIIQRVTDSKQFTTQEISGIEATLMINDMTLGDAKLLTALRKDIADPASVRTLAGMSQQDWIAKFSNANTTPPAFIAGADAATKQNNYATLLAKRAAMSYPTAAFAGDLSRAIDGKAKVGVQNPAHVLQFLNLHADFELATTSIDGYMQTKARPEFATAANAGDLVSGLKAAQRVYKVASNFAATNTLLNDNLHSAQQIYRLGQTQFVNTYGNKPGFTAASAASTFQRAANTHAAAVTMVGELRAYLNANKIQSLANPVPELAKFPNFKGLFGNADSCECKECESIFGAGAYLADLLHWLEGRLVAITVDAAAAGATSLILQKAPPPGFPQNGTLTAVGTNSVSIGYTLNADERTLTFPNTLLFTVVAGTTLSIKGFPTITTVKDLLLSRRPDIGYIELTCENSNTPVSMIDLACEIMEDRVSPWPSFNLNGVQATDFPNNFANDGPPDAAIIGAFAAQNPPIVLSNDAHLSGPDVLGSWVLHDTVQTYRIQSQGGNYVCSLLRQTHGTEEELSANPEYTNDGAYTTLSKAVAPLALPFDLPTEEIRSYLNSVGVKRSDLMTEFLGSKAPNNPQPLDIAADLLGIVPAEQNLILQPDPTHQVLYWGNPWGDTTDATMLASMAVVDTFLNRTGLEYADLQRMFSLSFVNPGGAIVVLPPPMPPQTTPPTPPPAPCDTTLMIIQPLDVNALDRIHRFLRLWRKLGWRMWEVDLVINHPALGNGTLDSNLALKLYPLLQIKGRFPSLTIEQLCTFYGDINTASKFTEAYQNLEPSLYENLFLNKRLSNPIDADFALKSAAVAQANKGDGVLKLKVAANTTFPLAGTIVRINTLPFLQVGYTLGADQTTLTLTSNLPVDVADGSSVWVPSFPPLPPLPPPPLLPPPPPLDPAHPVVLGATKLKQPDLVTLERLPKPGNTYQVVTPNAGLGAIKLKFPAPAAFPQSGVIVEADPQPGFWTTYTLGADKVTLNLTSPPVADVSAVALAYIDNTLNLKNLSFLYRHALLAKALKFKIKDWQTLLHLLQQDVFADPSTTWNFLKLVDRIKASNFSIDQLSYIITADMTAKGAPAEKTVAPALAKLQKTLQGIAATYNPSAVLPTVDGLTNAMSTQLQTLGWDADSIASLLGVFSGQIQQTRLLPNPPPQTVVAVKAAASGVSVLNLQAAPPAGFPSSGTIVKIGAGPGPVIGYTVDSTVNTKLNLTSPLPSAVVAGTQIAVVYVFPTTITNQVQIRFDPVTSSLVFTGVMTAGQENVLRNDLSLPQSLRNDPDYLNAIKDMYAFPQLLTMLFEPSFSTPLAVLPTGVQFGSLSAILAAKIQYDPDYQELTFFGIMTIDERDELKALSQDPQYLGAVNNLFTAASNPPTPFPTSALWLTPGNLVSYSPPTKAAAVGETNLVLQNPAPARFPQSGIITQVVQAAGTVTLNTAYTLAPDRNTLALAAALPVAIAATDKIAVPSYVENLEIAEAGLLNTINSGSAQAGDTTLPLQTQAPPGFPPTGNISKIGNTAGLNIAYALSDDGRTLKLNPALPVTVTDGTVVTLSFSAIQGLAGYVAHKLSTDEAIQEISSALGLTQVIGQKLLTGYSIFGAAPKHTLLPDFLDADFIQASSAITADAFPEIFQGYYWMHRVALTIKTMNIEYSSLEWIMADFKSTDVLDFSELPIEYDPSVVPMDNSVNLPHPQNLTLRLINLSDFMRFHNQWSDDALSFLDVVDHLIQGGYSNDQFASDVGQLTGWTTSDVQWLTDPTANNITIKFPSDFQTVDSWERLQRAFAIIQSLNADAASTAALADPALQGADSANLKQMLRGRSDEDTWAGISKPIQDALRERKRDSLIAYLLSQGMPGDAPTGKWNDPEDLFAYLLIDVEMCSCQPSSRIVQASAAVQLFVQRSFMGVEPQVRVSVDKDSAWTEWEWMKYYRVWEANRMVFAYPENYAEPELRLDKSEIFKNLENELMQNDVTKDNVEAAFTHYLEGLEDVARLEISGMIFQESTRAFHVFGRTIGGDPKIHYYRRLDCTDGKRWSPWSKVDCHDIKSDFVMPLVVNERLYLIWPEFRGENVPTSTTNVPGSSNQTQSVSVEEPTKRWYMYLALSEYRSGKWTAKRLSEDRFQLIDMKESEFDKKYYSLFAIDLTWLPDSLFPSGKPASMPPGYEWVLEGPLLFQFFDDNPARVSGASSTYFELAGCKGCPELFDVNQNLYLTLSVPRFQNDVVYDNDNNELGDNEKDPGATNALTPLSSNIVFPPQDILENTPGIFDVTYPHYMSLLDKAVLAASGLGKSGGGEIPSPPLSKANVTVGTFLDWFYADKLRTFFVRPELYFGPELSLYYEDIVDLITGVKSLATLTAGSGTQKLLTLAGPPNVLFMLHFFNFYHPLICHFKQALQLKGIDGLMSREIQFADRQLNFAGLYAPTSIVDPDYPQEIVDFEATNSYASYNWELFFHAPLMVAERLSQNQQFEEAMRWFHYIFDPTGGHDIDPTDPNKTAGTPQRYWITKPFYLRQDTDKDGHGYFDERIDNLMNMLASDPKNVSNNPAITDLQNQVDAWRKDPFDPHLVASYRTVAYQKLTVMKYLDNLIAWGDQLFTMDTLESVNSATQLYVLAAEILGERPKDIPPPSKPVPATFNELDSTLDAFSNALIGVENLIPPMSPNQPVGGTTPPIPSLLYFGIPQNQQLVSYWDTVEDRLYKIRHCLNIEGVFNPPALFAPPIDPMALVKARAAGLDISSALADLEAPLPYYRFTTMIQKAHEFVNDVKALGASLLSALEKKDAEGLALLRQGQEIALLQAIRDVKQRQIDDAQLVIDGLQKNKDLVTIRRDYYQSREFMNPGETAAMTLSGISMGLNAGIQASNIAVAGVSAIPQFTTGGCGFGGSPVATVSEGMEQGVSAAKAAVDALSAVATALDKGASIASIVAGYQRRMDDWQNQVKAANKELEQVDKQISSAQVKLDIAQKELANQDLQIANSQSLNDFMHGKYTNQDLYSWMTGQISQTYFQAYKLAFDLAKRAERCYRYEIGVEDSSYIQYGYWDSLRKGLQAGESLQLDLRRLESAYLDQNRREFECTKHISLAMLNPNQLLALKDKGICTFSLPEELFDLDYTGHYFRRVKSVSISIPCVAGPNTTVNATLRLLKNMVRINTDPGDQYEHNQDDDSGAFTDDDRFRESHVRINSIATSSGQNDSGMFELNFRDERYLPFEGAGAISTWQLELTQDSDLRLFSYDTISDIILHMKYTSREDVGPFRDAAVAHLKDDVLSDTGSQQLPLLRLFDVMHEFPTEWYAFLNPQPGVNQQLQLSFGRERFPFFAQGKTVGFQKAWLMVRIASEQNNPLSSANATLTVSDSKTGDSTQATIKKLAAKPDTNGFLSVSFEGQAELADDQSWQLNFSQNLKDGDVLDCYLVAQYALSTV